MLTNSTLVLGAFALFLMFGYISVLRTIARLYFPNSGLKNAFTSAFKDPRVLAHFGSSSLFMSIPATSMLLFWGWAPALMWLLVAHLLIDSITHLQISAAEQIQRDPKHDSQPVSAVAKGIHNTLFVSFIAGLAALTLSLMANLIDRQSGLVFALLFLLPAHQLVRGNTVNVARLALALSVVVFGIACAHQLGFSVYGEWQPLAFLPFLELDWLVLNNLTIVAAGLLIAGLQVARSTSFEYRFAVFTGALLAIACGFLIIKFVLLQASLDAPINASSVAIASDALTSGEAQTEQANTAPPFAFISLILFGSLSGLLFRLNRASLYDRNSDDIASRFGRLQWESVLQLNFSLVLLLSLAAAIGIGAWNSHYLQSPLEQNLLTHFDLGVASISALLDPSERTGTFTNTVLLVGLLFAGFSFLVALTSRLKHVLESRKPAEQARKARRQALAEIVPSTLIFLATCFLIKYGIAMQIWIVLGCLAWLLFSYHALGACASVQGLGAGSANTAFANYAVVAITVLGFLQSMFFVISWYLDQQFINAILLQLLIVVGISSWWDKMWSVIVALKRSSRDLSLDDQLQHLLQHQGGN